MPPSSTSVDGPSASSSGGRTVWRTSEALPAVPEVIEQAPAEEHIGPTLDALLTQADAFGLSRADLLIAARHYCSANDLDRLTPQQIDDLLTRMISRYGDAKPAKASANGKAKRRNGKASA